MCTRSLCKVSIAVALTALLASVSRVNATYVDVCDPFQMTYGSGWTDGTTKADSDLHWTANAAHKRSWGVFNLIPLPYNPASYDSVKLRYTQVGWTTDTIALRWASGAHPLDPNQSNQDLWTALSSGCLLKAKEPGASGVHLVKLSDWGPTPPQDTVVISWVETTDDNTAWAGSAYGWYADAPSRPRLFFYRERP
jgi:hypothetical protein